MLLALRNVGRSCRSFLLLTLTLSTWSIQQLGAAPESTECDLEPWLQEENSDRGYHVLCLGEEGKLNVYVKGLAPTVPRQKTLQLPFDADIPERLEKELRISNTLHFIADEDQSRRRWPKQSWAIFDDKGKRYEPENAFQQLSNYKGVLLLFEGGTWRWPGVRTGYERPLLAGVRMKTVSMKPALFELIFDDEYVQVGGGRYLGPQLLKDVVKQAERRLERSLTEGEASEIRTSEQAWLDYGESPELKLLKNRTVEALHIPGSYFEANLQVLRYKKGQLYDAHRDYWDPAEFPDEWRWIHPGSKTWNMRHATLLWYLQSPEAGGDTWFPRAHGGPVPVGEWTACDHRGAKMGGRNGTIAILFYSLYSSGDIDEFSWHCGCPVKEGVKWAANSWVWNQPQTGRKNVKRRKRKAKTKKSQSEL